MEDFHVDDPVLITPMSTEKRLEEFPDLDINSAAATIKILLKKDKLVALNYKLLQNVNDLRNVMSKIKTQNEILQNMVVKTQMVNNEIRQAIIDTDKLKGGFAHECWF